MDYKVHTENGGEYYNKKFKDYLQKKDIKYELIIPYIPKQNAVSQKNNHRIIEAVRSSIYYANLEFFFFG